ncbi:hypothetical protein KKHLCK_00385 [Candidatus Electrothrix laxa]
MSEQQRYAILIGNSIFPEEPKLAELRCPEHDVEAVDAVLRDPAFGGFTQTFSFPNRPSHEILPELNRILSAARKDDLVLVYYSGHGKRNSSGHLCLTTRNTTFSALEATSIPTSFLKYLFDQSNSRRKVLLLDCCYSGLIGTAFVPKGDVDSQLQDMSGEGTFIMTASTGIEVAVEKEGDRLGLFTKHLVEGIRSGEADRNEDGWVDMQEQVRAEGVQEPMQWGLDAKGKLVIARSGRAPKEKQLGEAESALFRLAAEGRLTAHIVFEAVQVLSIPRQEMTAKDQECSLLVQQLVNAKISPPAFIEQWLRTCLAHSAITEPQKKTVISVEPALVVPPSPKPQESRTIGRYTDHGDGTITDTKTGLMWKRCLEGLSGVNCEEGKVERYTWDEAVERFKNVDYAGYRDWRLPTIDELKTLVYCSKGKNKEGGCKDGSEAPTINQQAFPNTKASYVWSGSPYAGSSVLAWGVIFNYGSSDGVAYRDDSGAVRLVRGGQ